jgi:hypothetical protein
MTCEIASSSLFYMQHQIYFHFRRELLKTIVECEQYKIIVTHGTDTIIETAKYLQIQLQEDCKMFEKRIILTGNLSRGIDNCSDAWYKNQNCPFDNSFSNNFSLFQLETKTVLTNNVGNFHLESYTCKTCHFERFCYLISDVDSGGAGVARAPPEFEILEKWRSLISAFWSLAITASTSGFEKLSTALLINSV